MVISTLDVMHSDAVMPREEPTVLTAEIVSKSNAFGDKCGSITTSVTKVAVITISEPKIVASARRTDSGEISRLNIVTASRPRITAIKFAIATAIVLTLMPPAVDCDAPPIHIKMVYAISERSERDARLILLKPAVRGATALKME